jgi:hypothetical protein
MSYRIDLDRRRARLLVLASGSWTMADADSFIAEFEEVVHWSDQTGSRITYFCDATGLVIHPAPVAKRLETWTGMVAQLSIDRYALVVPSALMRMQCRRLVGSVSQRYFEDIGAAREWLGWEMGYRLAA